MIEPWIHREFFAAGISLAAETRIQPLHHAQGNPAHALDDTAIDNNCCVVNRENPLILIEHNRLRADVPPLNAAFPDSSERSN